MQMSSLVSSICKAGACIMIRPAVINSIFLIISLSSCAGPGLRELNPEPTVPIHAATSKPVAAVKSNDDWTPYLEEMSGVPMALVPPGCFMMGVLEDQADYLMGFPGSNMELKDFTDQMPAHEVCFEESFWIDVYEVTQKQFSRFNGEANLPSHFRGDALPREQVTWIEATTFCEQRDARLPTEAEWEYAARGPTGNLFPWGNAFDCRKGNFDDTAIDDVFLIDGSPRCDGFSTTSPVGSIENGASWVGAMDLTGNVWEWAADRYDSRYYGSLIGGSVNPPGPIRGDNFVVRGGAWSINEVDHLSAAFRGGIDPGLAIEHLGFRCVKSSDYGDLTTR